MDKRVIFAVAGAGKTATIINKLSLDKRSLIVTYTDNNFKNLKQRVIKKFGYLPDNIKIYTYFTFLYSFCYKPFLSCQVKAKGIFWDTPPAFTLRKKRTDPLFYINNNGRLLYHNRIAKLLEEMKIHTDINNRLEKYFDNLFIDEIQDFGGHDFNLLKSIVKANLSITFVGDFFQHTFDTSKDGNTNSTIYNDLEKYKKLFEQMKLIIDTDSLSKSYRCSNNICEFVSNNLDINIQSHKDDITNIEYIENKEDIEKMFFDDKIVKLFYQNSNKYNCYSTNWGKSKGQDHYWDVCIVLNAKTFELYSKDNLSELNPQTRNKLYVACTRCRGDLYFIDEKYLKEFKIK